MAIQKEFLLKLTKYSNYIAASIMIFLVICRFYSFSITNEPMFLITNIYLIVFAILLIMVERKYEEITIYF